jgi:hypothetical protein
LDIRLLLAPLSLDYPDLVIGHSSVPRRHRALGGPLRRLYYLVDR